MITKGHGITWVLLIGRCLLPLAAQKQLEHAVCEMWKKNKNNFLFALFEVKKGKNPQSIAELPHKATLYFIFLLSKDQSRGRKVSRGVYFDEFG